MASARVEAKAHIAGSTLIHGNDDPSSQSRGHAGVVDKIGSAVTLDLK